MREQDARYDIFDEYMDKSLSENLILYFDEKAKIGELNNSITVTDNIRLSEPLVLQKAKTIYSLNAYDYDGDITKT